VSTNTWERTVLADLLEDTVGGLWGSPADSTKADEADVLVVRGADFRNWDERRAQEAAPRRVPVRSIERRRLKPGDLVLEVSGGGPAQPVGRVLVIDEQTVADSPSPLICSNFCRKLRLKKGADPFFVKRQLDWLYGSGHTERFQTATTNIRNLQVDDFLRGTEVVLPAPDQQILVSALLDAVDLKRSRSVVHVAAAQRAVARLRQAVLNAACSGRLTVDWRGSDGLVGWQQVKLQDVCESIADGDHQAPPQVASGVPFVTISAMNDGQLRLEKATRFVTASYYGALKPQRRPQRGDVLFSVTGSIGIPAHVDTDEKFTFQRHIAILRPDPSGILSKYLFYALGTSDINKQALAVATGTAQLTIPLRGLRSFVCALPPDAEQQEIVRRVEGLLTLADRLDARIDAAARRIERSSQAVLAKAFRGELGVNGSEL
jgi:type I restriction enzyme, S subunit